MQSSTDFTLLLVIIIGLMWAFRNVLKRMAKLGERTVVISTEMVDDTMQTYSNEVMIANAQTRSKQIEEVSRIEHLVTSKEVQNSLQPKVKLVTSEEQA